MKDISIVIREHAAGEDEEGKVVSTCHCTVDENDGFLAMLEYIMTKKMSDSMVMAFNGNDKNPEHIKYIKKMSTDAIVKQFHKDRETAKFIAEAERKGVDPNILVKYKNAGTYDEDIDVEAAFRELIESIESNF